MTAADQPTTEPNGWRLAFMRAGWLREGDVVDLEDVLEEYGDAYNSRARSAQETVGPVRIEGPDSDGEVVLFVGPVAVCVPAGERVALHLPDPAPQPAEPSAYYCGVHGDLLAAPRSVRCAEAPAGHEYTLAPAPQPAADTEREEGAQRLARAAFLVDSTHHFHTPEGSARPVCLCGFVGSARKRTQTEHITAAVLEAYDHD